MAASWAGGVLSSSCMDGINTFYALFVMGAGLARAERPEGSERSDRCDRADLPVRAVLVKTHPDRRNSLRQPAMHGTLEALREFQRARYRLDDQRRVALGTSHKLSGEWREGKYGGESGIRTHGRISPTHAFRACSLNRSDISPS